VWNEKTQKAFKSLKEALTTPPILAMPEDNGEFVMDTDASDQTIGAVLSGAGWHRKGHCIRQPLARQKRAKLLYYSKGVAGNRLFIEVFQAIPDGETFQNPNGQRSSYVATSYSRSNWSTGLLAGEYGRV